ncbi:hypothetical protein GCM10009613_33820 [Pseudonocardia kongjuensis]|uniref:Uncharacterized protein n=1 Tax=Pseudonocardia kongjuensis TaxID=102227 RepID=A0ABN1XY69_9PSEU
MIAVRVADAADAAGAPTTVVAADTATVAASTVSAARPVLVLVRTVGHSRPSRYRPSHQTSGR